MGGARQDGEWNTEAPPKLNSCIRPCHPGPEAVVVIIAKEFSLDEIIFSRFHGLQIRLINDCFKRIHASYSLLMNAKHPRAQLYFAY